MPRAWRPHSSVAGTLGSLHRSLSQQSTSHLLTVNPCCDSIHWSWLQADLTEHDVTKAFVEMFPAFPSKKNFAAGVLIRRTSHCVGIEGTVIPTLRWLTLVALETISCIIKKKGRNRESERKKPGFSGSLLHSQLSMSRQATLTFSGLLTFRPSICDINYKQSVNFQFLETRLGRT